MNPNSLLAMMLPLVAVFSVEPAVAQAAATFTVRNDTNRTMNCGVRKTGSAVSDEIRLRAGETWTQTYPKRKARAFRCEGAAPIWYTMRPGQRYRLAPNQDGLIVLTADVPRR